MDLKKIENDLIRKGVNPTCPICSNNRTVGKNPVRLMTEEEGRQGVGSDMIALFCNNCGNAELFVRSILES